MDFCFVFELPLDVFHEDTLNNSSETELSVVTKFLMVI